MKTNEKQTEKKDLNGIIIDMGIDNVTITNTDASVLKMYGERVEKIKDVLHITDTLIDEFEEKTDFALCPKILYEVSGYIGNGLSLDVIFEIDYNNQLFLINKLINSLKPELKQFTYTQKFTKHTVDISAKDSKIIIRISLSLLP